MQPKEIRENKIKPETYWWKFRRCLYEQKKMSGKVFSMKTTWWDFVSYSECLNNSLISQTLRTTHFMVPCLRGLVRGTALCIISVMVVVLVTSSFSIFLMAPFIISTTLVHAGGSNIWSETGCLIADHEANMRFTSPFKPSISFKGMMRIVNYLHLIANLSSIIDLMKWIMMYATIPYA